MAECRFRGKYDHMIDDKGRLSFPSRFREILRDHQSGVLIAIAWEDHLRVYPVSEWERLENGLKVEENEQPDLEKVLRYLESEIFECTLDSQGRLLLPPSLRAGIGIKKDIVLIGMIDRVEIWDREKWGVESSAGREQFREHRARIKKKGII